MADSLKIMKIISGKYKGRKFFMPKGIRPTQDVVRKALFDLLGQDLTGLSFLDLFAGSGAMGLEAASRGAKEVVFVEKERFCFQTINENMIRLNIPVLDKDRTFFDMLQADALATIKDYARRGRKFDIVFADPPYGRELAKKTLITLKGHDILHPDSIVVIQHTKHEILPETEGRFFINEERRYGATLLTFYKLSHNLPVRQGGTQVT